jgi:hypothetical protein
VGISKQRRGIMKHQRNFLYNNDISWEFHFGSVLIGNEQTTGTAQKST